jgi:putative Mg2+ transporter-C (MgtC) family protein
MWPIIGSHAEAILRLLLAALLGGAIGYERERAQKPAGLRTNMLVCMGSALFCLVSARGFGSPSDLSRVAAGVVVGIGFLGAGTILHENDKVLGLTTAATVWAVAAIGLALGCGLYVIALASALLTFAALRLKTAHHHE